MASDLFKTMGGFNQQSFLAELNKLKQKGGDPAHMIQELLKSGRVSQAQVNQAMGQAQQIMQMLTPSGRR